MAERCEYLRKFGVETYFLKFILICKERAAREELRVGAAAAAERDRAQAWQ